MNGYKAFYNCQVADIYAESLHTAKQAAIVGFKVPRSEWHMVSVVLCEKDGKPVKISIAAL